MPETFIPLQIYVYAVILQKAYRVEVMDSEHLLHCPTLNHESQQTKDLVSLYSEAREKNYLSVLPLENK
jgi:hypothetical protein